MLQLEDEAVKVPAGKYDRADDKMFSHVSVDRVSQAIVDQIRMLIREGRLSEGDRLPSERDLCQRFGVSRVTVREALRVLEAGGLIKSKVGAHGGSFVTTPSTERIGEGLADLLILSPVTAGQVTEARIIVELGILPLVVDRATEEDIQDLRALVDQGRTALERGEYTMDMSAAFHVRVSSCAHNPAIEALMHSFHGPMLMSLQEARTVAPLMGHRGTEEHSALVDAIARRDVDGAVEVMRTHLQRTADRLARLEQGQAAEGTA